MMSFLGGSKRSTPEPVAFKSPSPASKGQLIDKSVSQVKASSVLLADVTSSDTIDETRRKARVLGPAAAILG